MHATPDSEASVYRLVNRRHAVDGRPTPESWRPTPRDTEGLSVFLGPPDLYAHVLLLGRLAANRSEYPLCVVLPPSLLLARELTLRSDPLSGTDTEDLSVLPHHHLIPELTPRNCHRKATGPDGRRLPRPADYPRRRRDDYVALAGLAEPRPLTWPPGSDTLLQAELRRWRQWSPDA